MSTEVVNRPVSVSVPASKQTPVAQSDAPAAPPQESYDQFGDSSRLLRYANELPVIGGFVETGYAIKELQKARSPNAKVNAGIDTTLGVTGSINAMSDLPVYLSMFTTISKAVMAVCAPLTGITGAFSVLDGGRDIYNATHAKNHVTDKKTIGIGSIKIAAATVAAFAGITGNIPLLIGASLVGTAAIAYQNRKSIVNAYHTVMDKITHQHPETAPAPAANTPVLGASAPALAPA